MFSSALVLKTGKNRKKAAVVGGPKIALNNLLSYERAQRSTDRRTKYRERRYILFIGGEVDGMGKSIKRKKRKFLKTQHSPPPFFCQNVVYLICDLM